MYLQCGFEVFIIYPIFLFCALTIAIRVTILGTSAKWLTVLQEKGASPGDHIIYCGQIVTLPIYPGFV